MLEALLLLSCSPIEVAVRVAPAVPPLAIVAPAAEAAPPEALPPAAGMTVVALQTHRRNTTQALVQPDGRTVTVSLLDLAPAIGVWFVLTLREADGSEQTWHLENSLGTDQTLALDDASPTGLLLVRASGRTPCDLWGHGALEAARAAGHPYGRLCEGALWLRNPTVGQQTRLEWTTDLLRDHVVGGERITSLAKRALAASDSAEVDDYGPSVDAFPADGPVAAALSSDAIGRTLPARELALPVDGAAGGLGIGAWYRVHGASGVWASVVEPRALSAEILAQNAAGTAHLDAVEQGAIVYSAAFDLQQFAIGFEAGSDHPRVGWSEHAPLGTRTGGLAGPDGFDDLAPLVRTGLLDPDYRERQVAVFAGGFKRAHGALGSGEHYGFVQQGTVLSRLRPGLATLIVWADQSVELRTWTEADDARIGEVRHARQNGVPVLEPDPITGIGVPGAAVIGAGGNWSGSAGGNQRTVRGGLCLQESAAGRFLVYSQFSNATPSAMADVYAAYGCSYAMLVDMNAAEHTYLAVRTEEDDGVGLRHLVTGMEVLDWRRRGDIYPRFAGYPDNRDFFYVLRRP